MLSGLSACVICALLQDTLRNSAHTVNARGRWNVVAGVSEQIANEVLQSAPGAVSCR